MVQTTLGTHTPLSLSFLPLCHTHTVIIATKHLLTVRSTVIKMKDEQAAEKDEGEGRQRSRGSSRRSRDSRRRSSRGSSRSRERRQAGEEGVEEEWRGKAKQRASKLRKLNPQQLLLALNIKPHDKRGRGKRRRGAIYVL